MARTEEDFSKAWSKLQDFVKRHDNSVWLVATSTGYAISVVKPKPRDVPEGTVALLYNTSLVAVDKVEPEPAAG